MTKKLSEVWEGLPTKEKNVRIIDDLKKLSCDVTFVVCLQAWRKKAKKLQQKQDGDETPESSKAPANLTHMQQAQNIAVPQPPANLLTPEKEPYQVTGNGPIDLAAHMSLLGESLATIGAGLQEHKVELS